jgi:hypothetical protein
MTPAFTGTEKQTLDADYAGVTEILGIFIAKKSSIGHIDSSILQSTTPIPLHRLPPSTGSWPTYPLAQFARKAGHSLALRNWRQNLSIYRLGIISKRGRS